MRLKAISNQPDVMGGTAVFTGTRVPVQTLIDYLQAADNIDDFLGRLSDGETENKSLSFSTLMKQYLLTA